MFAFLTERFKYTIMTLSWHIGMVFPYRYDDTMEDNEENIYKRNGPSFREEINKDLHENAEKFKELCKSLNLSNPLFKKSHKFHL